MAILQEMKGGALCAIALAARVVIVAGFLEALWLQPARAQQDAPPVFDLPIACSPGKDCWVLNYVDMEAEEERFSDYKCNPRTYDGHKGTDFAIPDRAAMEKGVAVQAAADGVVTRIRDGEPDRIPSPQELEESKDSRKECGNAVLIAHRKGLQTIYCHMKQGSIAVRPGQAVRKGDRLGEVGLSGYTQFPHLHFGVLWKGVVYDPFSGTDNQAGCETARDGDRQSLWRTALKLEYQPLALYAAGFSNAVPTLEAVDNDVQGLERLGRHEEALTFWFVMFGARQDDRIELAVEDPDGVIFVKRDITQPKSRARQFYYAGRKTANITLKPGTYIGRVTLARRMGDGQEKIWSLTRQMHVQ